MKLGWIRCQVWPLVVVSTVALAMPLWSEMRQWTSAGGSKIQAELEGFDGEIAKLRTDSQTLEVPVTKLAPEDQIFLRKWLADNPPKDDEDQAGKRKWPDVIEVPRDMEITVVSEDAATNRYVYRSENYEVTSPIRLSKSVMQEMALIFESTYKLLEELPLGLNLRTNKTEPLKILLVEDVSESIALGGNGDGASYINRIDTITVTLDNLGAEKKGSRWSFSGQDVNTVNLQLRLAQQLYRPILGPLPTWFTMGFGKYMAEIRYKDGRFFVSQHRSSFEDHVMSNSKIFPMEDLEFLMSVTNSQWSALISAGELGKVYSSSVVLSYYFTHLDGEGDGAHLAEYIQALVNKENPKQAVEKYLMRGRSYEVLAQDLMSRFRDDGIRIEVQPPRGN